MKIHWDDLHRLSREEILSGACVNTRFAYYDWDELEEWLRGIIQENLSLRSGGLVSIT